MSKPKPNATRGRPRTVPVGAHKVTLYMTSDDQVIAQLYGKSISAGVREALRRLQDSEGKRK